MPTEHLFGSDHVVRFDFVFEIDSEFGFERIQRTNIGFQIVQLEIRLQSTNQK